MNQHIEPTRRISPMSMKKYFTIVYAADIGHAQTGDIVSKHTTIELARKTLNRHKHAKYLSIESV